MKPESTASEFILAGYEDMEISTQIVVREALARGVRVEVLDRVSHFLRLSKGACVQYVKEATKTAADSYMSFLIMEDKELTKILLREVGLRTPEGGHYRSVAAALADFARFEGRSIVVKPTTTNFGSGVVVFEAPPTEAAFRTAVESSLQLSPGCLVEEFVAGPEYRFLTIDGATVAVCNRVPANVRGDGVRTIAELVAEKNRDPRRGVGHVTPLEKIQLGETELGFLSAGGRGPTTVPAAGEQVFLRKNSNISTGGDSIDCTDQAHPEYLRLAERAAAAVDAKICGVDIIIPELSRPPDANNYAILELNFNPVLYIHEFPYQGQARGVGKRVLDLLGF